MAFFILSTFVIGFFGVFFFFVWTRFGISEDEKKKFNFQRPEYRPTSSKESGIRKRVAIIGAGCSGLTSIKACLEEDQIPVCFEMSDDIGGLWRYTKHESHSSVMESTIINTSKQMMSFSDFPPPDSFPTFMDHSECLEYFKLYADKFNLRPHIKFNTFVKKVLPIGDTGRWRIVYNQSLNEQSEIEEEFDAVMVCSGHHWKPYQAKFSGEEKFQGKIFHAHTYKSPLLSGILDKKRFLVVGVGNSGVDIAVELSRIGKTYLSTRRGAWILSRQSLFGRPLDHVPSRLSNLYFPLSLQNFLFKIVSSILFGDLTKYEHLAPKHEPLSGYFTIHSELLGRLQAGRIMMKPNIKEIKEHGVVFEDGSEVTDLDVIVICTGYTISYPFFDNGDQSSASSSLKTLEFKDNYYPVYKLMLPLKPEFNNEEIQQQIAENQFFRSDLKKLLGRSEEISYEDSESVLTANDVVLPNFCFIGLVQPLGALMPLSELQARWFVQYLIGAIRFSPPSSSSSSPSPSPSSSERRTSNLLGRDIVLEIQRRKCEMKNRFYESLRHTIQVDYFRYADEVAEDFGATNDFSSLKEKYGFKFALWWLLKLGSPVQFRLKGPHPWSGAHQYLHQLWSTN